MPERKGPFRPIALVAAVLAWIVPGAGHLYLGKRARGLVILFTIGLTFWGGVAMGGAMTVYSQAEPWWFAADMLTGVHGLAAWQYQQRICLRVQDVAMRKAAAEGRSQDGPEGRIELFEKELAAQRLALVAPADSVARAYSGVAGLLNLLCIFDAMMLAFLGRLGEPPSGSSGPGEEKR
jgi:hypothetical protein